MAMAAVAGCAAPEEPPATMPEGPTPVGPPAPASSSAAPAPAAPAPGSGRSDADTIRIAGHVVDDAYRPIAGATVRMLTVEAMQQTGPDGAFDLGSHRRGIYPLQVSAPGHVASNTTVLPDSETQSLKVVLLRGTPVVPYNQTWEFQGVLQCAFEALIISPSCDSAWVAGGQEPLFGTNQSFLFRGESGWKTLVIDLVFDPDAHPGLDGLRFALRGTLDTDGGGEYQQYGRWSGPEPFTVRVEPGGNYTDGVEQVPFNATGFQLDVYPHSHGYHPGGLGFLGVGAAIDVEFQVYATVFYVEPAPEGYSFAL